MCLMQTGGTSEAPFLSPSTRRHTATPVTSRTTKSLDACGNTVSASPTASNLRRTWSLRRTLPSLWHPLSRRPLPSYRCNVGPPRRELPGLPRLAVMTITTASLERGAPSRRPHQPPGPLRWSYAAAPNTDRSTACVGMGRRPRLPLRDILGHDPAGN
jgi:hypothetical protein